MRALSAPVSPDFVARSVMSDLDDLEEIVGGYTPMHPWYKTRMKLPACTAGHAFTPENTRWRLDGGKRSRVCLACRRKREGFKGIYKPRASRKVASSSAVGYLPAERSK